MCTHLLLLIYISDCVALDLKAVHEATLLPTTVVDNNVVHKYTP